MQEERTIFKVAYCTLLICPNSFIHNIPQQKCIKSTIQNTYAFVIVRYRQIDFHRNYSSCFSSFKISKRTRDFRAPTDRASQRVFTVPLFSLPQYLELPYLFQPLVAVAD